MDAILLYCIIYFGINLKVIIFLKLIAINTKQFLYKADQYYAELEVIDFDLFKVTYFKDDVILGTFYIDNRNKDEFEIRVVNYMNNDEVENWKEDNMANEQEPGITVITKCTPDELKQKRRTETQHRVNVIMPSYEYASNGNKIECAICLRGINKDDEAR